MSDGISTGPTVTGDVADKSFMHPIDQQLVKFGEITVLCVGDLMLDHFVYGDVSRVSPEAPSLVIAVGREEQLVGGAGNVARGIAALGARCIFAGVIGEDESGRALARKFVDVCGWIQLPLRRRLLSLRPRPSSLIEIEACKWGRMTTS